MTQERFAPDAVAERARRNVAERGLARAQPPAVCYTVARLDANGTWTNDWDGEFFTDRAEAQAEIENAASPGQPYGDLGWTLLEVREVTS